VLAVLPMMMMMMMMVHQHLSSTVQALPMSLMGLRRISGGSAATGVRTRATTMAINGSKNKASINQTNCSHRLLLQSYRKQSSTPFEDHPLAGAMARCSSASRRTASVSASASGPAIKETGTTTSATISNNNNKNGSILAGMNSTVPTPSYQDLKSLFIASSIPMIGFGFMDNFVMIQAGHYIDSTLGVTLGLATLTAAAAGTLFASTSKFASSYAFSCSRSGFRMQHAPQDKSFPMFPEWSLEGLSSDS
jgi:hypothetical protein